MRRQIWVNIYKILNTFDYLENNNNENFNKFGKISTVIKNKKKLCTW